MQTRWRWTWAAVAFGLLCPACGKTAGSKSTTHHDDVSTGTELSTPLEPPSQDITGAGLIDCTEIPYSADNLHSSYGCNLVDVNKKVLPLPADDSMIVVTLTSADGKTVTNVHIERQPAGSAYEFTFVVSKSLIISNSEMNIVIGQSRLRQTIQLVNQSVVLNARSLLAAISVAAGTVDDGDIAVSIKLQDGSTNYGKLELRRAAGASPPAVSCADTKDSISVLPDPNAIAKQAGLETTDQTGTLGGVFTYRLCIYDAQTTLVGSVTAGPVYAKGKDHLIFFTSATFKGNLGGRAGADLKCDAAAKLAGWPGTYHAVISTSDAYSNPKISIQGPVFNAVKALVAQDSTDFYALSHTREIVYSEIPGQPQPSTLIWTGGHNFPLATCLDWTSDDISTPGSIGSDKGNAIPGTVNFGWYASSDLLCSNRASLMCISEPLCAGKSCSN